MKRPGRGGVGSRSHTPAPTPIPTPGLSADALPASSLAFIEPCLAQATAEPPSDARWVHEIKYDGYRVQAHVRDGRVTLSTRSGLDWTGRFGTGVAADLAALPVRSAILDGEAIVQDKAGVSEFAALQRELKKGSSARIVLMAFDLLHLDGRDMRALPLLERKQHLGRVLAGQTPASLLQYGSHMQGDGREILEGARKLGLEGIVSKRADQPYRSGRQSGHWLKCKCVTTDPFVVVGYAVSNVASQVIGSLVLGYHEDGSLVYAGRVGTGFTAPEAGAIWQGLQQIRSAAPPLARALTPAQRHGVVWVTPVLIADIEYRSWSSDRLLRHAAFKAFRQDRQPSEVQRPDTLPPSVPA